MENLNDNFALQFSKYVLSQIYNMTHGDKAGISLEDLLVIFKRDIFKHDEYYEEEYINYILGDLYYGDTGNNNGVTGRLIQVDGTNALLIDMRGIKREVIASTLRKI